MLLYSQTKKLDNEIENLKVSVKMHETELECPRCSGKIRICLYPPIKDLAKLLNGIDLTFPMVQEIEYHSLSSLLKTNEELGQQNKLMKARLETVNDFMQTVFGEETDMVTLWQMSEIVSRIERLKAN